MLTQMLCRILYYQHLNIEEIIIDKTVFINHYESIIDDNFLPKFGTLQNLVIYIYDIDSNSNLILDYYKKRFINANVFLMIKVSITTPHKSTIRYNFDR